MFTRLQALTIILFIGVALCFTGCARPRRTQQPAVERTDGRGRTASIGGNAQVAIPANGTHTVIRGETVYAIASKYGLNFRQLAEWNTLKTPFLIYPGQQLRLKQTNSRALTKDKKQSNINKTQENVKNVHQVTVSRSWKWPTNGRVIKHFDARDPTRNGIDIAGQEGQPVFVADAGQVVYSGSGLASYGNLIIIKHDDRYLTAYGYNAAVLIKEGDELKAGTMIARMGKGPDNKPALHFQVRLDGKPVNPLNYLPK